jgi:hypothetical protein
MSLSITLQNEVIERAKSKNDGCYQLRGCAYRVRSGRVTHLAYGGEVLQPYGHFNVLVGKLEHYGSEFALKFLKTVKD